MTDRKNAALVHGRTSATPPCRRPKRALRRDIARTFHKSKGRFVSIVALLALGAFALVGFKVTGPDMRATAAHYLGGYNLADLTIIGGMGIDADDEAAIAQASAYHYSVSYALA